MITYKSLTEKFNEATKEEKFDILEEFPEKCLITGFRKCDSYYFEEGVVYLPQPPYDAYTLPEYDSEEKEFQCIKIDMDEDFVRDDVVIGELCDFIDQPNFQAIKDFYEIPEEDIRKVRDQENEDGG